MRGLRRALLVLLALIAVWSLPTAAPARERVSIICGPHISRVHPWRCLPTGVSGSEAWSVYLVHLRWSNWGGLKARAHGYVLNWEEGTRWAAKVLVYGRTSCDGKAFYRGFRLGYRGHTVLRGRLVCPS
jgi:hypothetical protein